MSTQIPGAFERTFSVHPRRKLRVFFLIVFVFFLLLLLLFFFQTTSNLSKQAAGPLQEQKVKALSDLKERLSTSPPISQVERNKALAELQTRLKTQRKKQKI